MKKIVSLVVTGALILSYSTSILAYATDTVNSGSNVSEKTSTSSDLLEKYKAESELFGTTYEEVNKPMPRSISANSEEREEFQLDRSGLASITSLTPLTTANYEVILSYVDKNTFVTTADTLQLAILKAQELAGSNLGGDVIPAVIEKESQTIVYATEAMGRVVKVIDGQIYLPVDKNSNVYSSSILTQAYTYVNHGYVDDVPILEDNGTSAKVEVSGYTGWMRKDTKWINPQTAKKEYDLMVVPLNKAVNPSYYMAQNGELTHTISYNMETVNGSKYTIKIGVAPTFMQPGVKYYSYDGNYFYTSLKTLIADGKAGHHNNAVNASTAFYNYYQYLPFRSKTAFAVDEIKRYLDNNAGLSATSKLRGVEQALVSAQEANGVNALITFGVAMNESGLGNSSIAQEKNNLFGINAVDANPGQAANTFATVGDCINEFTKNYISNGYADPDDWRYFGGYLGNKNLGANVKYASDPFWGEKAAQYMYKMDFHTSNYVSNNYGDGASTKNLMELNHYQLGTYTKPSEVNSSPQTGSEKLYPIAESITAGAARVGNVFVVKNTNVFRDGTNSFYNIIPDRPTIGYNYGGRFDGIFDWNKEAYTKADGVKLINVGNISGNPPTNVKKGWIQENNQWYYYDLTTGQKRVGWLELNGKKYYLNENGARQIGWQKLNNRWYYFDNSGEMKIGWILVGSYWYYMNLDGTMRSGWLFEGGTWYYLRGSGEMATGWVNLGGKWYYLRSSGAMATGWISLSGKWYYLTGNGDMVTGTVNIGGKTYKFNSSGVWLG
ncbi:glucosaminidase domain-containing protein [Clostridium sp.]|uniref:glucosaminidase domain-containing protein n=1 Tax=Clostridium sp. TaxID=1506 RepID=UPI002FC6ECE6